MLQQTQVATVLPYYRRFMQTFPDVDTLAAADEQALMNHWEGLGYYRRARSMHAAAKRVVSDHNSVFPTDFDDVLALPGIGRYTAGAILSISGDARYPVLEGNTQRVFSRWVALRSPPMQPDSAKLLWKISESMLPPKSGSGIFNQAAMELGALVCTAKTPKCDQCPVKNHCVAHDQGLEAEIPGKVTKVKYEDRKEYAFVVAEKPDSDIRGSEKADTKKVHTKKQTDNPPPRYLMRPLPAGGRWAGLWDFPRTIERSLDSAEIAAAELSQSLGEPLQVGHHLIRIKHAVTKFRIELQVHHAILSADKFKPEHPWRFVSPQEMEDLPLSVTGRKIAKLLK